MRFQDLLNSSFATALGLGLSGSLPPRLGLPLARWIADGLERWPWNSMACAARANQWIVHEEQPDARALDALTQAAYRSAARSLYEFWHFFNDPERVREMVVFDPSMQACIARAQRRESGTLLVTPHIANFDMVGRALALHGLDLHILSYPRPPGGYRSQNRLREMPNMRVTPMSPQALHQAAQTLRANRVVLTGVDRPLPVGVASKYRPRFFGRAAAMPVFHVRLALKHHLPITVLGARRQADGRYCVWASEPIPMQPHRDLVQETVQNAEAILALIAENIRAVPEQWAMFYPVWPEALARMP